jgi:hypothetical protein
MPHSGLSRSIDWSRKQGEAKEQELIGMTPEAEIDMAFLASYVGVSAASTASTGKAAQPATSAAATFET